MKPGSTGPALPGIHPVIYDDDGNAVPKEGVAGNILIRNPWPGAFPNHLGGSRSLHRDLLRSLQQGSEEQGLARLALSHRRCRGARG